MNAIGRAAVLAFALASAVLASLPSSAQTPTRPDISANPRITIDYIDPRDRGLFPLMERLKQRQSLEELSQFLSPLQLLRVLRLKTKQCDTVNAFYDPSEWAITFCYEYLAHLDRIAPKEPTPEGFTRNDVVVGGFVDTMLHELGHALFDMLSIPLFGRQEDAADQLAAFLMLQFGKEVALMSIKGAAYYYKMSPDPQNRTHFADEHGTASQRFYNYFCIAYGGDPETFRQFVDKGVLPKSRADGCAQEYKQVERAFLKTFPPYIDYDQMKKVQAARWLQPELGK